MSFWFCGRHPDSMVHSSNFYCHQCWLEDMTPFAKLIYLLKRKAEGPCGKKLDCGGNCHLPLNHNSPCLCVGDEDGEPGTCPA